MVSPLQAQGTYLQEEKGFDYRHIQALLFGCGNRDKCVLAFADLQVYSRTVTACFLMPELRIEAPR
jgi:hypothetical protein